MHLRVLAPLALLALLLSCLLAGCGNVIGVPFGKERLAPPDASLPTTDAGLGEAGGRDAPACKPSTCPALGFRCGVQNDGCGDALRCGTCGADDGCISGQCVCQPKTCMAQAAACGTVPDGCGGTFECGVCPASAPNCGGGGVNICGVATCTPLTCAGKCGPVSDGCGHLLDCGACTAPATCGGGATASVCGCSKLTCAEEGANCGSIPDGCGGTLACGACAGSCEANVCSVCTPATCASIPGSCGSFGDGCGGTLTCGACAAGTCTNNVCSVCMPATCTSLGKTCGSVADGCGGTLSCGSCTAPATCGGGGTPNVCGGHGTTFTVGGVVSGLAAGASVVLQDDGAESLTVTSNGPFVFATPLPAGQSYAVMVETQPAMPVQACVVTAGSGTISANVTSVTVVCTSHAFTVGGTLAGLAPTDSLLLQDNGDELFVGSNGAFTFGDPVLSGSTYDVTVLANPTVPIAQTCTITMPSGTVGAANVSNVAVACVTNAYTVGGALSGLAPGAMVVLQDNAGDNLTLAANGSFTFPTSVASGASFAVTVLSSPASQACSVTMGAGTVEASNVTSAQVTCVNTYAIGGTVSGLAAGDSVVLQNNGGPGLTLSANGPFAFAIPVAVGQPYAVTVETSPPSPFTQTCTAASATGTVAGAPVTSVTVTCAGTCLTFEGCIDGEDQVTVLASQLSVAHIDFSLMGEHPGCEGVMSTVNPSVSLYDPVNGVFAINGVPYPLSATPMTPIVQLIGFALVSGRGPVTLASTSTVDMNDNSYGGPGLYVVQLCD